MTAPSPPAGRASYRFDAFLVSRAQRALLRDGKTVPLIPRYFDLLLLLLERRHEAVHRDEIFDRVWGETIVSDGSLSQAIRTLRQALGDDARSPRYIRTVSRHGYQFAFPAVVEESPDDGPDSARSDAGVRGDSDAISASSPHAGAARAVMSRASGAMIGGACAGAIAGLLGGVAIRMGLGSSAAWTLSAALSIVGAIAGGLGALGVGVGLATADAVARANRSLILVAGGAFGGGVVGAIVNRVARWTFAAMFGRDLDAMGGGVEGTAIGAAVGLAYALATRGDARVPERARARSIRLLAAASAGVASATICALLAANGGHLVSGTLNLLGSSYDGSQVGLAPVARLFGQRDLGMSTLAGLGAFEGLLFGVGLALGLTHRRA